MPMAAQTYARIHRRFQIMGLRGSPQESNRRISGPSQNLVREPPLETRPHMARNTANVFVRRFGPALVGRRDGVASGTELRLIGQWNRNPRQSDGSDRDGQCKRGPSSPVHAPGIEGETAESEAQRHRRHRPDATQALEDRSAYRTPPQANRPASRRFRPTDHAPR